MAQTSKPKVIACGHRQIQTKSGNSFPAFLIRLPDNGIEESDDNRRFFWRSKRDFLVLNRSTTEHSFPKKAFAKLSNQAPWVRPDDEEAPSSGGYCKFLVRDCDVSDSIIENKFNPNMKKSLQQLDEFLLKASSASKQATSDNDGDDNNSIVKAWKVFCKSEHTNHLVDDSNNSTNNLHDTHTPTAAKLGQYFASDDNARLVIKKMMETLERDDERSTNDSLVFVEPSCGDGRIISELLHATKHLKADSIQILGYDIDPTAIERAKASLSESEVGLECKDFLSLSKRDLLSAIATKSSTTTEAEASSRKRRRADDGNGKVIVVGGPPYTPKPLPQQFILHSIQELKAEIVVFMLPKRCKKDADHLQQVLNSTTNEATSEWLYSNTELENIDFSFEQSTIQQPSVLQCWYKRVQT